METGFRPIMVNLPMIHLAAILHADKHKPAAWKYKGGSCCRLQNATTKCDESNRSDDTCSTWLLLSAWLCSQSRRKVSSVVVSWLCSRDPSVNLLVGILKGFFSTAAFISISVEMCGISCWFPRWMNRFSNAFQICGLRCLTSILPLCKIMTETVSESASYSSWWYRLVCTLWLTVFCFSNLD